MQLGYIIIYVADVDAAINFYQSAFGLTSKFVHESGDYAELQTGSTVLAFASHELGNSNFPYGYTPLTATDKPAGLEIAFVTDDVAAAVASATDAGASLVAAPAQKPWGQTVAYVQAPDGVLIELCTSMG